jgi:hypothetical protein
MRLSFCFLFDLCHEKKPFSWFGVSLRDMKCCGGMNSALWLLPKAALRIIRIDSTPRRAFRHLGNFGNFPMDYSNIRKKGKIT